MKCADPILCFTDGSKRIFRHFSLASPIIKAAHQKVFPCGKCLHCRKKKSFELATRCVLHASLYGTENCFLTLTYDEKREDYNNTLDYTHIQKFKKRLRQYVKRKYNKKIEIFNVHEYGKKGKKHWHLIVFNFDFKDKIEHPSPPDKQLYTSETLSKLWSKGFCTSADVTEASAMYQAQYMEKDIKNGNTLSSKKSKSNHSGLGKPYFLKNYFQILSLGYVPISGKRLPIPRYFEKLAARHYAHFYDRSLFHDTLDRKALYRPFTNEQPNLEIANLYKHYRLVKETIVESLEQDWNNVISQHLTTKLKPDFIKANENRLHDLKNKQTDERF